MSTLVMNTSLVEEHEVEAWVDMDGPAGPRVIYNRADTDEALYTIEEVVPVGWAVSWATPAATVDGGYKSKPLVKFSDREEARKIGRALRSSCRRIS